MKLNKSFALLSAAVMAVTFTLTSCSGAAQTTTTAAATKTEAAATTASTASETTKPAAAAAADDQSWEKVQAAGELLMGLDDNFPPMGFRDAKNEIVGFDVDLAREVAKRLEIKLVLTPIDWKMKENEINAGHVDVLWNGFSYTDERDKALTLSKAYLANDQVVIVMAKSGYKSLADLSGKTLALQEGSSAQEALDAATAFKASLKEVVPFSDNVTALLDLESGNSDALLVDKVVGEYFISQKNAADYLILPDSLSPETYVIGFRKGDVALKDKVEEMLDAMQKDGTMAKIATQWFGHDATIYKK